MGLTIQDLILTSVRKVNIFYTFSLRQALLSSCTLDTCLNGMLLEQRSLLITVSTVHNRIDCLTAACILYLHFSCGGGGLIEQHALDRVIALS